MILVLFEELIKHFLLGYKIQQLLQIIFTFLCLQMMLKKC